MDITTNEALKMLEAKKECLERSTSGTNHCCNNHECDNCNLCYEQGNMGEQKLSLEKAIDSMKKLQQIQKEVDDWHRLGNYKSGLAMIVIDGILNNEVKQNESQEEKGKPDKKE